MLPPTDVGEPLYPHNHTPSITRLPKGDLFAIWYTTREESGTELTPLQRPLRPATGRHFPGRFRWRARFDGLVF